MVSTQKIYPEFTLKHSASIVGPMGFKTPRSKGPCSVDTSSTFVKTLRKRRTNETSYLQYVIGAAGLVRRPTGDIVYVAVNLTYECQNAWP